MFFTEFLLNLSSSPLSIFFSGAVRGGVGEWCARIDHPELSPFRLNASGVGSLSRQGNRAVWSTGFESDRLESTASLCCILAVTVHVTLLNLPKLQLP